MRIRCDVTVDLPIFVDSYEDGYQKIFDMENQDLEVPYLDPLTKQPYGQVYHVRVVKVHRVEGG